MTRCYGFDGSGDAIIEDEAKVIRDCASRLLGKDRESLRSVVADLRERGIASVTGGTWTQHTLSRLLRNPRLAGLKERDGQLVKARWPAILTPAVHRRLVKLLADPARRPVNATNVRKYILSGGLLACGFPLEDPDGTEHDCGKQLYTQPSVSAKRGYVCRKGPPSYGCGRIRIAAEPLEEEVAVRAMARLGSPKIRARLERAIGGIDPDDTAITDALAAIDERRAEAGREYATRAISMTTLKAIEAEARAEQKSLRERHAQAQRLATLPALTPEELAVWWVDAPLEARRDLLALVLEKVIVRPATRRGFIRLDPDRLEFRWK